MERFGNLNSVMEAETISKNEASPKSLMSRGNVFKMFFIVIISALLFSCNDDNGNDKDVINEDITKSIDDVITVKFPKKSISTKEPIVQKMENSDIQDIFEVTSFLFQVEKQSAYQIKIDLGRNEPIYENPIEIVANIPNNLINSLSNSIQLFALIYQNGGMEIIDHFEVLPSEIDITNQTITATLPYWAFTNARNGNYETYLMIASLKNDNSLRASKASDITVTECFATTICPTATCEKTSDFDVNRLHPVTNKVKPHYGTDFRAPIGTSVYAIADGKINYIGIEKDKKTGETKGWGRYIIVEHETNPRSVSVYAHLSEELLKVGDRVTQGQEIAKSGNTGIGTGPHLHMEFRTFDFKTAVDQSPCIETKTSVLSDEWIWDEEFEDVPMTLSSDGTAKMTIKDDKDTFLLEGTWSVVGDIVTLKFVYYGGLLPPIVGTFNSTKDKITVKESWTGEVIEIIRKDKYVQTGFFAGTPFYKTSWDVNVSHEKIETVDYDGRVWICTKKDDGDIPCMLHLEGYGYYTFEHYSSTSDKKLSQQNTSFKFGKNKIKFYLSDYYTPDGEIKNGKLTVEDSEAIYSLINSSTLQIAWKHKDASQYNGTVIFNRDENIKLKINSNTLISGEGKVLYITTQDDDEYTKNYIRKATTISTFSGTKNID
jgi:murein DD-endopeptidase MepM/ murein hydrolase activator NlpD